MARPATPSVLPGGSVGAAGRWGERALGKRCICGNGGFMRSDVDRQAWGVHRVRVDGLGRARPWALCALTLGATLLACSEPRFGEPPRADAEMRDSQRPGPDAAKSEAARDRAADASSRDGSPARVEPGHDAGLEVPPLPGDAGKDAVLAPEAGPSALAPASWAPELVGQYAVEVFNFIDQSGTFAIGHQRLLATVEARGGEYELTTQLCLLTWIDPLTSLRVARPERLPPRRHRVLVGADSFSTEPIDTAVGFELAAPAACADNPGKSIPAPVARSWTSATSCECPGERLPRVDDCRVRDSDGDDLPGYTIVGQVTGLSASDVYGVMDSRSRFVNGRPRAEGGFVAQEEGRETWLQYGCRPSGCLELSGTVTTCAPEASRAVFVPLAGRPRPSGGWTCGAISDRAAELFVEPALPVPSRCSR